MEGLYNLIAMFQIFTDVGNILSDLRKKDFQADFGPSHASKAFKQTTDDPAVLSSSLRDKLAQNRKVGDQRIREVLNKVRNVVVPA